ncbi:MAG: hypothetical protein WCW35_08490 [Bacteroidota bacterium]|jgi:hypothetical protein
MNTRKLIGFMLVVLAMLSVVSPVVVNAGQAQPMSIHQMEQTIGGLPVVNIIACTALLAECLASTEGWWADILCMALTAGCLTL